MTTAAKLKTMTVKDLGNLAKECGIVGWHDKRKEELIYAIYRKHRSDLERLRRQRNRQSAAATSANDAVVSPQDTATVVSPVQKNTTKTAVVKKATQAVKPKTAAAAPKGVVRATKPATSATPPSGGTQVTATSKTATSPTPATPPVNPTVGMGSSGITQLPTAPQNDQVVLMVRDPYWLHLFWRLSQKGMDRAKAALSHFWHTSVPVLRVYRLVSDGISNPRKEFLRDIRIHNRVSHWYIDVYDPPSNFQVEVGYLTRDGNFFSVASSNIVETPLHHVTDNPEQLDGNWWDVAQDFERIVKMSGGFEGNNREMRAILEEQLRRPLSSSLITRAAAKPTSGERTRTFSFQIQADLVIHGQIDPTVRLTVRGEPITVAKDGSFAVRYGMAEKRHVYPVQAITRDGSESQIIVLTVDRNTKILETVFQEIEADD